MTEPTPAIDPAGPLAWLNDLAAPPPGLAPLQASDPVTYRGAITIPKAPTPAVGGGAFRIDRERAPDAIRELEDAVRQLEDLRVDAVQLGRVSPSGSDEVSRDAAVAIGAVATGGQGSFVTALDGGVSRLHELIRSLREDVANYGAADGDAAARIGEARA